MIFVTAHDLVKAGFVYLAAGSVMWMFMDHLGIVENSFEARLAAGKPVSMRIAVLATVLMILAWPKFAWAFVKPFVTGWR